MDKNGYGGRVGGSQFDNEVVDGLQTPVATPMAARHCKREDCGHKFRPRREDDEYCSRRCESAYYPF
jgi:hypothetical protein